MAENGRNKYYADTRQDIIEAVRRPGRFQNPSKIEFVDNKTRTYKGNRISWDFSNTNKNQTKKVQNIRNEIRKEWKKTK